MSVVWPTTTDKDRTTNSSTSSYSSFLEFFFWVTACFINLDTVTHKSLILFCCCYLLMLSSLWVLLLLLQICGCLQKLAMKYSNCGTIFFRQRLCHLQWHQWSSSRMPILPTWMNISLKIILAQLSKTNIKPRTLKPMAIVDIIIHTLFLQGLWTFEINWVWRTLKLMAINWFRCTIFYV